MSTEQPQSNSARASHSLSRRHFLTLTGGVAGLAFVAACAAPGAAPAADGGSVPAAESRQVIFWGHDQHPMDLAAEGFVEEYPDIEWISPHPADRVERIQAAFAAGSGLPDLFWAEATNAQDWGCNELLLDLSTELEGQLDQYHPLKVNETFVAKTGRHVGWPGDISVSGWYYREDKLIEAGYGDMDFENWTWNDFFEMAAGMREQGMYAFVFPADGWSALFMYALHQLGGSAISRDGETITVGDERGIRAMQIVKQLWDAGGLDVGWWSAPYWASLRDGELVGDFAAAWARGFWEEQLIETGEAGGLGEWRLAKFPGGPDIQYRTGVWGGAQLVSPTAADNSEEAILFMRYALGSMDGAARCGEWGIIPAYRPYLQSEEFQSMRSSIFGDFSFNEFWAAQEQELSTEFYRPAGWGAINTAIGVEMVPILLDELSIEEGMDRIIQIATPDFERTRCM